MGQRFRIVLFIVVLLTLLILNVSRSGLLVEGCLQGCSNSDFHAEADEILSVMSLNMLHGFPKFEFLPQRLDLVADEILQYSPDIVCLQEVPWTLKTGLAAKYLAERTGMNYVYYRANGNRWSILFEEGEAILSRYPLADPVFQELQPPAGFFEQRVVLGAKVITPMEDIQVFVTHLTNKDAEINLAQTTSLLAYAEEAGNHSKIIAGDFNAEEDSPQIQLVTQSWYDAYRVANPSEQGFTCCVDEINQPAADNFDKRIDYIFFDPDELQSMIVKESKILFTEPSRSGNDWLYASDHAGILTYFSLESNP